MPVLFVSYIVLAVSKHFLIFGFSVVSGHICDSKYHESGLEKLSMWKEYAVTAKSYSKMTKDHTFFTRPMQDNLHNTVV